MMGKKEDLNGKLGRVVRRTSFTAEFDLAMLSLKQSRMADDGPNDDDFLERLGAAERKDEQHMSEVQEILSSSEGSPEISRSGSPEGKRMTLASHRGTRRSSTAPPSVFERASQHDASPTSAGSSASPNTSPNTSFKKQHSFNWSNSSSPTASFKKKHPLSHYDLDDLVCVHTGKVTMLIPLDNLQLVD